MGVLKVADPSKVKEAVEWYENRRVTYDALAKKVKSIILELLKAGKVDYHSVTCRSKSIARYRQKASEDKYTDPMSEIHDMAGIRIITYIDPEAKQAHDITKKCFDLIPELSIDKSEELGVDRVGYRSIHCVGTLGKERLRLPENKIFKGMTFEIQIRTILQHAWAEFEHDRNYTFKGVLPPSLRRRLSVVAGNLELADREFESIAKAIDDYTAEVKKKTETGDLQVSIDSKSLVTYLTQRFKPLIKAGLKPRLRPAVVPELLDMEITTLQQLEDIIPKGYLKSKRVHLGRGGTFTGLARDLMLIHDADKYFKKAWKSHWKWMTVDHAKFLSDNGVDIKRYAKKYGFPIRKPLLRKVTKS
jgi:putative GTP pyrophosphokinase